MSEIKSRSIRLDDENWQWLSSLPGRSANEAISALRDGQPEDTRLDEVLEFTRSAPSEFEEACLRAIARYKADNSRGVNSGGISDLGINATPNPRTLNAASDSSLLPCRHCGEDGKISPRTNAWRACGSCAQDGHMNFQDCRRCLEIAHAKKLAASSTGTDDPSVTYDWKDPA